MEHNFIRQLMNENNEPKILEYLMQSYKVTINDSTHEPDCANASMEDITVLTDVIQIALLSSNHTLLKETFRCLRNCVVKNVAVQSAILESDTKLLDICKELLLLKKYPNDLKNMLLTFLINISIGSKRNSTIIWMTFDFNALLNNKNIAHKVFALIYNIFLSNPDLNFNFEFFTLLLVMCQRNIKEDDFNEFAKFTLELFIKNGWIYKFYNHIELAEYRILILQETKELQLKKYNINWSQESIITLSSHFKKKSDCILKTVAEYVNKIDPYEVSLLADVLASLSSDEQCLRIIQNDRSLLINCAFLLKSMHDVGKLSENSFSPIGNLDKTEKMAEEIKNHPAFGFRVNMIRILGNLAWKCRHTQDEMRNLNVIPLLLDNCNIDGRNPFIIQWVVFSIRNLCENNSENQKVIASLNKQGIVDSNICTKLGLPLYDGPKSINIAPLI